MKKILLEDSNTETFAALKLTIDNWRWADVPFYIQHGKTSAEKAHGNCYSI